MSAEVAYLRERYPAAEPARLPSEQDRFEALVRRHDARLRKLVTGIVGRGDAVDDVLQDAYVKAYRRLPRFANEAHEATWLYRVAYRCSIDELRRRRRRPETSSAVVHVVAVPEDPIGRLSVEGALATLSADHRAALLLVDLLGFDYPSAARVLRVPRGTVASRVSRARQQLERALA